MLVFDFRLIGNKLYDIRKKKGLSRAQIAEMANLSDRTYADIERGSVNMRVETMLKICKVLNITPNEILTIEEQKSFTEAELTDIINRCSKSEKQTALNLLNVYLDSLNK